MRRQCFADGFGHCAKNVRLIAELDFAFGWVNIHVNRRWINLDVQHHNRMATFHQQRVIRFLDYIHQRALRTNPALIDEQVHVRTSGAKRRRLADIALNAHLLIFRIRSAINRDHLAPNINPVNLDQRIQQVAVAGRLQRHLAIQQQRPANLRVRQRVLGYDGGNLAHFGRVGAHKFEASGRVIE